MDTAFLNIKNYRQWLTESGKSLKDTASFLVDRLLSIDKSISAFVEVEREAIIKRASELDAGHNKGRLLGVPIATKGNICLKDRLTTCSSRILQGFRPPYSSTVSEKLTAEGALIFNGANMDEFAFGSSCETSCTGPTKNPWDVTRIPGGSSGGSTAAVAAREVLAALGSDTGGSIRQPAAMCGVVGLKPTYGRVSRYGLIAFASSLDQIGPITNNVADCAAMLEIIAGYDEKDSTSVNIGVPRYTDSLNQDINGVKIGIPKEYFIDGISEDVRGRVNDAINVFKELGAETVDISLPHTKYAVSCYYIIGPAEASSNLARYDGVHYGHRDRKANDLIEMYIGSRNQGFGTEAKRRILLGT
ncbi:MAG: amidase family protein, partial [Candidatus Omnitrophota bacterium]